MNLQPTNQRVLVAPIEMQQTHEGGGIWLPEIAWEKQAEGTVLKVGEKVDKTLNLQEGDRIVFNRGYGTEIEHEGKKLLLINQNDLLAVLEPAK